MILALHGFLGEGDDWQSVRRCWPEVQDQFCAPDLFSPQSSVDFSEGWSLVCQSLVESLEIEDTRSAVLMGYSFGGRLALELARRYPDKWKALVLLSTNPALTMTQEQCLQRQKEEQGWQQRMTEGWDSFLSFWNQQLVFAADSECERESDNYNMESLKWALQAGSVTRQQPFAHVDMSALWLFGAEDRKYVQLGKKLERPPYHQRVEYIEGVGHRLWAAKEFLLVEKIRDFLGSVELR